MELAKPLDWSGQTCVVCASGPSFTAYQATVVKGASVKVIVVNNNWEAVPFADVLYACDYLWWKMYYDAVVKRFTGQLWTQDRAAAERWPKLHCLRNEAAPGLGQVGIRTNGNSGAGAINLAYLFKCKRILLLGFDMKLGPKGERHWHPDHPKPLVQSQTFEEWRHKMRAMAKDLKAASVEVINCSPGTALETFPLSTIEKELSCSPTSA
jgi:hypothetical protein